MEQRLRKVEPGDVLTYAALMKTEGCRLVQILCTRVEEGFELTYSFDNNYTLINVRTIVLVHGSVMSITSQYWYAFLWENEIHDLFDLQVDFIEPDVDFKGEFFHLEDKTPWYDFNAKSAPQAMKVNIRSGLGVDASVKPAPVAAKPQEATKTEAVAKVEGGAQNG